MKLIKSELNDGILTVGLQGHIDSNNAADVEAEITEAREGAEIKNVVIDMQDLQYISSAGLRILLRLKKIYPELRIVNVSSEVYEVLNITGFTEMMNVQKAYRELSVEGCEVIGQGANGKVYRIDADTIVKVYFKPDALPDIERERELARTALILGIPTAIPYDIVKIGEGYGSVFELLNAKSFAKLIQDDPGKTDEVIAMSVDLLKKIHGTLVNPDKMPDMKKVAQNWAAFLKDYLPEENFNKLVSLVDGVPEDLHMLHGDYHLKNIMLQDEEVLLIDMDTLCTGHPVFEFASVFNAYQGYSELDHDNMMQFLGIPYETGAHIWEKTLELYFDGRSREEIAEIADKAKLIGYTRNMRRLIRRDALENEKGRAEVENCKKHILELTEKLDTLTF
ncbi:MAG: anti-sigma factor antagonist [Erysipelotrichaceae bacterium]|nr:anti-sigma factor antagonist [Erysipelotrichaceae bacterium]